MRAEWKKESDRKYYLKNAEKIKARTREWKRIHVPVKPKRVLYTDEQKRIARNIAVRKQYWAKREKFLEYVRKSAQKYPDRVRHRNHLYRARRKGSIGTHTVAQWEQKLQYYGWKCYYCKKSTVSLTRDHAIPLVRGGMGYISNILPACRSCNSRKRTRTVFEWRS